MTKAAEVNKIYQENRPIMWTDMHQKTVEVKNENY